MLLQFNFESETCLLAIFIYWLYLPNGKIGLLTIFVFWQYLPSGNICLLAIFVFWQYLSSGNICLLAMFAQWQYLSSGNNWPTHRQYLLFKLMLSCQLEFWSTVAQGRKCYFLLLWSLRSGSTEVGNSKCDNQASTKSIVQPYLCKTRILLS